MRLTFNASRSRFEFKCKFDERHLAQEAGLFWDSKDKLWVTFNERHALKLLSAADEGAKVELKKSFNLEAPKAPEAPKLVHTVKLHPEDLKPYQVQLEAVFFALSRKNSFLGLEQGLGKTAVSVMISNHTQGLTVIVCPTFLKENWRREIERWSTKSRAVDHFCFVLSSASEDIPKNATYIIVPYSLLTNIKVIRALYALPIKLLVLDEAHYCKNHEATTTKAVFGGTTKFRETDKKTGSKRYDHHRLEGLYSNAERVVCLSGTPIPNRYMDLFVFLKHLAPHTIKYITRHEFGVKYCGGYNTPFGWSYAGATNGEELYTAITKDFMLIRRVEDCIDLPPVLPPKVITVDPKGGKLAFRVSGVEYAQGFGINELLKFSGLEGEELEKVKKGMKENELRNFSMLSEIRKTQGLAKAKVCAPVIEDLLAESPLVVFAYHTSVIETLAENLKAHNPLIITGQTKNRQDIVDTFQTSPHHNLIICQIKAAGVGLTLTKSSTVVFVEWSWQHGENEQAASRCRRIGQTKPFQRIYLSVENSIDTYILNNNLKKQTAIDKIVR